MNNGINGNVVLKLVKNDVVYVERGGGNGGTWGKSIVIKKLTPKLSLS